MGLHAVGNKELFPAQRVFQVILETGDQNGVQGYRPDQAALSLDGDGVLFERARGCGSVDTEALVNPESFITPQVEDRDEILPVRLQSAGQHTLELRLAPGAVYPLQGPALEDQLLVAGELIAGPIHQVVKEPDGGQVGFDCGGGHSSVLQVHYIGINVLGADVGQALKVVAIGDEAAEPLCGLIVPGTGLIAP